MNKSGQGLVVTCALSFANAVRIMPGLLRDIFDLALGQRGIKRAFDISGGDEQMDMSMSLTENGSELAIVNYKNTPVQLLIRPLHLKEAALYELTDLKARTLVAEHPGKDFSEIKIAVPGLDYILLRLSEK